ncbi:MAG: beta-ketoacyl-[acyl-carrier-protein] synthase family protein [Firmicutes bacterium]|nr:beta-ketoacyl-[acyl-carrier-protein] synthase family protein [Bacillota bacterium]
MNRDVYLNHASIVTGLGTFNETWEALLNNKSGIVKKEHFDNSLLPKTGLALFKRDFTGVSANFTQFLMEECLSGFPQLPEDTFVIWTGIKNDAPAIESYYDGSEKPSCASAHEFRTWLTHFLGLTKGGMELNAACASSTVGVALAVQFIKEGKYDHILVAGADAVSRFVYYGFAALKAMTEAVCMPFDLNRQGLSLGDGAVALFLSAERGSDIKVTGYGITNDANHITGPSRDGAGLAEALGQAIAMSGLKPDQVQGFCAHGTGTRYNDSMEILAVRSLFGEAAPLIFGVKGAIGHTLGAAGGIEIALCSKCLTEGMLPATVGCKTPEFDRVIVEKTPFPGRNIITTNSGFGGVNAAVLLEKLT